MRFLTLSVADFRHAPPRVEIFFLDLFSVIVACSYVLGFKDQTPSQSKIFSVIVDCTHFHLHIFFLVFFKKQFI